MMVWEFLINFSFIILIFFGSLAIKEKIINNIYKTEHSFRVLTQSVFLKNQAKDPLVTAPQKRLIPRQSLVTPSWQFFPLKEKKRPKLLNQKGEFHLLSANLFFLLLLTSFYLLFREFESYRRIVEKKENYLCLKHLLQDSYQYTLEMTRLNQLISINYPLQFNPKTGPVHKQVITAASLYQEVLTKKFSIKLIGKKNYCSKSQRINFARLKLYQIRPNTMLVRDAFKRALPIEKKQKLFLFKNRTNDFFNLEFSCTTPTSICTVGIFPTFNSSIFWR